LTGKEGKKKVRKEQGETVRALSEDGNSKGCWSGGQAKSSDEERKG
jgi:hypothetical protein